VTKSTGDGGLVAPSGWLEATSSHAGRVEVGAGGFAVGICSGGVGTAVGSTSGIIGGGVGSTMGFSPQALITRATPRTRTKGLDMGAM
jgi:hypothetical protein